MHLQDLCERLGPYWAAFQAYRRRERVFEDPDYVRPWFLVGLLRDRVAAARVGVEKIARPNDAEAESLFHALRLIEDRLRTHGALDLVTEQLVAGLLGAQEIETERERRDTGRELIRTQAPRFRELADQQYRERVDLAKKHLRERGISTSSQLATLHHDEDTDRELVRRAQWQALDELADEVRAR